MAFDPTKPVKTRGSRKAEILSVLDEPLSHFGDRIVAVVTDSDGDRDIITYQIDGRHKAGAESGLDLVNIPQKHKRWAVIYPAQAHQSCDWANIVTNKPFKFQEDTIACIEIEFEDGEGLS